MRKSFRESSAQPSANGVNRCDLCKPADTGACRPSIIDRYFMLWVWLVPITSVLVFPTIQGTTPGYLMGFMSLPAALLFGGILRTRYVRVLCVVFGIWLLLFLVSQLTDVTIERAVDLSALTLVDPLDTSFVMRTSMFTQSLYLLPVMLYAAYLYIYYNNAWDGIIVGAGVALALYGLYEWGYYLVTGQWGDFLSNRAFGNLQNQPGADDGTFVSSGFQLMEIGGVMMMRVKSLTGEPSMYALSMFPFWVYARYSSRTRWPALIIGVSLVLTASTTALIGYLCYLAMRIRTLRINVVHLVLIAFTIVVILLLFGKNIEQIASATIFDKLSGANESGQERSAAFLSSLDFWLNAPLGNQLFGIGFGYIRSTDMFSTLLVNNGAFGVALFSLMLLYPAFKLDAAPKAMSLRICCVSTYLMMMVSVPEFSYLAPWTFVAIAYHRLRIDVARRS